MTQDSTTLASPLLSAIPGLRHAFFTREGGVSGGIYQSLNAGVGSHDDPDGVERNRAIAAAQLGLPGERLVTCHQVHGTTTITVTDPFGHSWSLATHKEDVAPEEMARRSKDAMSKMAQQAHA